MIESWVETRSRNSVLGLIVDLLGSFGGSAPENCGYFNRLLLCLHWLDVKGPVGRATKDPSAVSKGEQTWGSPVGISTSHAAHIIPTGQLVVFESLK